MLLNPEAKLLNDLAFGGQKKANERPYVLVADCSWPHRPSHNRLKRSLRVIKRLRGSCRALLKGENDWVFTMLQKFFLIGRTLGKKRRSLVLEEKTKRIFGKRFFGPGPRSRPPSLEEEMALITGGGGRRGLL